MPLTTPPTSNCAIEVRRALPEDYQAVLDINHNVYQGADYIPSLYYDLINDPDFCYYVCLVNREVAAFEGICHLDGNRTLMLRSLRVKAKFQGWGLSTLIKSKIIEDFKDSPQKRYFRHGCSDELRFIRSKSFLSKNTLLKTERRVHFHEADVRKLMIEVPTNHKEAKPISWEDFSHLLQIKSVKSYLYPDDIMTQDYWFYDAAPGNVRHIQKRCSRVFITRDLYEFLSKGKNNNKPLAIVHADDTVNNIDAPLKAGVLGIVSCYFSPAYLCITINVSGNPREERKVEDIASIVRLTLEHVRSLYVNNYENRKLLMAFVCSHQLPEELFYEAAKPYGLEPSRLEENFKNQYYFEENFNNC